MLIQSLRWEDPLEDEMETHSSILAWEISQTEEPGELQMAPQGCKEELDRTERLSTHMHMRAHTHTHTHTHALQQGQAVSYQQFIYFYC